MNSNEFKSSPGKKTSEGQTISIKILLNLKTF